MDFTSPFKELAIDTSDFSQLELCACKTVLRNNDYYLFYWFRLMPGQLALEPLGTWNDGSYDAKDAGTEAREAWPNTYEVSYFLLENELKRRIGEQYHTCNHKECKGLAYEICNHCGQYACLKHHEEGDFENWCLPCWNDYLDILRLDGDVDMEEYRRAKEHIQKYLYS